jgi:cellulose synthase/poly-beta-1,6-N-acetylglucosamine synthase-like glycosyltransferase
MFDLLIDTRLFALLLLGLLAFAFIIQMVFYWGFFWRLGSYRQKGKSATSHGISVVICAHNEHHQLKENLPLYLDQDYPEYEVLVVNHASDDDTPYLLTALEEQYPHLKTLSIQEDLNFFTGKKFPLSIGIKSAKYDIVLLTDADCKPASRSWISEMQSAFTHGTEVVLGYGPYNRSAGWLNKLIRFDTAHIAIQYLSYALAGLPYMGVGRNLSYVKNLFYRNKGFISHYRIRSGDDDLFINSVANRRNTAIMVNPGSYTFSDPKQTFGKWITQKKRHLSTSTHYRFSHKFMLGLYAFSLVSFYALLIGMLALNISISIVLGLFVIRLGVQYLVLTRCMKQLNERDLIPLIPVYEGMLLLLNAGVMVSNVFRKPSRWK